MSLEEAEAYKASCTVANEPSGAMPENAHAFEDLTDFQASGFLPSFLTPSFVAGLHDLTLAVCSTEYGFHICAVKVCNWDGCCVVHILYITCAAACNWNYLV
jgi:hypothetical protein